MMFLLMTQKDERIRGLVKKNVHVPMCSHVHVLACSVIYLIVTKWGLGSVAGLSPDPLNFQEGKQDKSHQGRQGQIIFR